jgi:hypothetical protein
MLVIKISDLHNQVTVQGFVYQTFYFVGIYLTLENFCEIFYDSSAAKSGFEASQGRGYVVGGQSVFAMAIHLRPSRIQFLRSAYLSALPVFQRAWSPFGSGRLPFHDHCGLVGGTGCKFWPWVLFGAV